MKQKILVSALIVLAAVLITASSRPAPIVYYVLNSPVEFGIARASQRVGTLHAGTEISVSSSPLPGGMQTVTVYSCQNRTRLVYFGANLTTTPDVTVIQKPTCPTKW